MADSIFKRVGEATRAAVGIFTNTDLRNTWNLFNGILPGGLGTPPNRYTRDYLKSYSQMPWLRAVGGKIAFACAQVEWKLNTKTTKPDPKTGIKKAVRDVRIQRAPFGVREKMMKQAFDEDELKEITDHPLLDVLNNANSFQTGLQMRKVTQLHLDLAGEAFWLKERDSVLGTVVGVWPIPPDWIMNTPTPHNPFYRVGFRGWQGMIPDTEFLWFQDTDPVNPYARGTGTAQALSDELETDEYTAKHTKAFFYNRAKPDLLIFPKSGSLREDAVKRLETDWMNSNQGFWRAFKPYFMTREVGVHEMDQNFRAMQLVQLREFERDIILQTFGLPPELLGVLAHSNRATIDAADYLMSTYVVQPRLEFMRTILQEKFVPEYDDRLIITYESPIKEDTDLRIKAATAAPWTLTVDEWRTAAGHEILGDGKGGDLHAIPQGISMLTLQDATKQASEQHAADIAPPPPPIIAPGAGGRFPPKPGAKPLPPKPAAKPPAKASLREAELEEDSQYELRRQRRLLRGLEEVPAWLKYSPDQPRDDHGRWAGGGAFDVEKVDAISSKLHTEGVEAALAEAGPEFTRVFTQLRADAVVANTELDSKLRAVASKINGTHITDPDPLKALAKATEGVGARTVVGPLKSEKRMLEKALDDYGGNVAEIKDAVRGTIAVDTVASLDSAIASLHSNFDVVREKNRFEKPTADGYRDYLANVKLSNGMVGEVQIHLKPLLEAKNNYGHAAYEKMRTAVARHLPTAAVTALSVASAALYAQAWAKAGGH